MASSHRYAELHLHLEGCLDEDTLLAINPALARADVDREMSFSDFPGFLSSFKFAVTQLQTVESYRLLARRAFARLHAQGIVYAEVIHSAGVCLWRNQDARAIAEALIEEGQQAPIQVRWVFDAVRQFGADHVLQTAKLTMDCHHPSLVGFGIGGDETGTPWALLRPAFDQVREAGLKILPHAGETSKAENVWGALEVGAYRIGHGIRAIEDPKLVAELVRRQIPLDISITSNVMTGAVGSYDVHPVKRLFDAGVPITLNTDDPAFFKTGIEDEFQHARNAGFSEAELEQLRLNAFRFATGVAPQP